MSKEKMPSIIKREPADMHEDGVHFDSKIKAANAADKRAAKKIISKKDSSSSDKD
ncbi:MAG: hypothetical protein WBG46_14510 [Nonlabens sp.]